MPQTQSSAAPAQGGVQLRTKPITADQLYTYLYPWNPFKLPMTVIGVAVRGTSRTNKKYLPPVYAAANLYMLCHSCGCLLSEDEMFVGDHQPPIFVYDLLCNPLSLYTRYVGKAGLAARTISENARQFPMYVFNWKNRRFQTNDINVAWELGGRRQPVTVYYGDPRAGQFLYPHCKRCSDAQRDVLR